MPRHKEERIDSKKIRKRLIDLEMTQRELAKIVGMKENFLTDVLAGRKPGTKYVDKIYEAVGLKRVS